MATVLIVDDRATHREVARATLDHGGHHVIEATEGQQALAMARTIHPDLILTDLVMPGMDGYELAHALRTDAGTADIPVLLYTAHYSPVEAQPLAMAYGVAGVLTKSDDPFELLTAVEQALHDDPAPTPAAALIDDVTTGHLHAVNAKLVEKVLALDESEARFEAFAELAPVGIAFGGPDLHATYVNPRLSEITATPAADLLGPGWLRCLTPERHSELRTSDALPAGTTTYNGPVTLAPGIQRHLQVAVRRHEDHDDHDDRSGFIAVITDVTPLIEAEQRRHAEERVADLVGMLSHDVRQPLAVITGYINTVTEDWDHLSETRRRQFLQRASSAAQRMNILVEDILALTHLDAGTIQPRRAVIDVRAAIIDILEQLPAEDAMALTTHFGERDVFARVDPGHLQQIMLNLVGNALKYGQAPVDVRLTVHADNLDITVSDQGEGVPAEFIPDLFARFTRANTGVAVTKSGNGLGLYIVAQLAEVNHATVTYQPNQPTGARFTLRLPTTAATLVNPTTHIA